MTIFVTGAGGFIGRHVIARALADGHHVRAVCRQIPAGLPPDSRLTYVVADIASVQTGDLRGCDAILHLAACGVTSGGNSWEGCFRTNVLESVKLWQAAAEAGVRRFVISGSCFEYGQSGMRYQFIPVTAPLEPTTAYAASKAAATVAMLGLALERGLEATVLRPFHVFGEGESSERFWPSLKCAATAGKDFPMTKGEQIRDFVPVADVAEAFVSACSAKDCRPGEPLVRNVGTGKAMTLADFAAAWWANWGATGRLLLGAKEYRPNEVMRYVPEIASGWPISPGQEIAVAGESGPVRPA